MPHKTLWLHQELQKGRESIGYMCFLTLVKIGKLTDPYPYRKLVQPNEPIEAAHLASYLM